MKARFNKQKFKYAGKPYIYRGLIRCAQCGLAITPEKHKGHVYYHCTQYNGKHGAKWLRKEEITRQLAAIFQRLQLPKDIAQQIADSMNEVHQYKMEFHNKHYKKLTAKQKEITLMRDNLYIDKLKGRITESNYDRFYQQFYDQARDVNTQLEKLHEAQDNYYTTAKYILKLANHAHELFVSSEVEEKRLLVKLVLSNLKLDGRNLLYDAHKPFDIILDSADRKLWRPQRDSNPCFRRERAMS